MLEAVLLILGFVLILFLAEVFGLQGILTSLAGADMRFVALAVLMQAMLLGLMAARLMLLTRRYSSLGFAKAFYISLVGTFVGFLSPLARLGGEPVKVYLMKDKIAADKGSAAIAMDILAELISLFIVVMVSLFFLQKELPDDISRAVLPFLTVSAFLTLVFVKVCTNREWLESTVNAVSRIPRLHALKEKNYATRFYKSFKALSADKPGMLFVLLISVAMKFLEFARLWLVVLSLGYVLGFKSVVLLWIVFLVLSAVPWLPGGLGLVEGGMILLLIQMGLAPHTAGSAIILDRLISYWLVLLAGFAAVWFTPDVTYRFLRKLQ